MWVVFLLVLKHCVGCQKNLKVPARTVASQPEKVAPKNREDIENGRHESLSGIVHGTSSGCLDGRRVFHILVAFATQDDPRRATTTQSTAVEYQHHLAIHSAPASPHD
jgi:hypothetical protein